MNHPNCIGFSCNVGTTTGGIYGGWHTTELVDLMSMMDKDQRLASKGGHQYVTHFFHGGRILLVGIMYFPEYIDDDKLRLRCIEGFLKKLITFVSQDIQPGRIVFRMEEVEVIWEPNTTLGKFTKTFSPDSLAGVELQIQDIGLPARTS